MGHRLHDTGHMGCSSYVCPLSIFLQFYSACVILSRKSLFLDRQGEKAHRKRHERAFSSTGREENPLQRAKPVGILGLQTELATNCHRFASRADPLRMFIGSMELHWVSISLALPLSLLRRPRVEPPGISEDLAKR